VQDYRSQWLSLDEACAALGVSVSTLWRLRDCGLLRPGIHWLRTSPGARGRVQINLPAVHLLLQVRCAEQHAAPVRC
jgi:hypothetical protein